MRADRDECVQLHLEAMLPTEWLRLVRLCAHLSGRGDVAEDLAQETLIEAWRHAQNLRHPDALQPWLSGIARNVCLRWSRSQGRDAAMRDRLTQSGHERIGSQAKAEFMLEPDELASLLDRALGLLPAPTRDVLVQHCIEERSHGEIAARLGVSEGAIAVRIHRGKLALKRAMARPELRADALGIGLIDQGDAGWYETRVWCPSCGRHRLETRIDREAGDIAYRCSGRCFSDGTLLDVRRSPVGKTALKSAKSILARQLVDLHAYYRQTLAREGNRCHDCKRPVALERWSPDGPSPRAQQHPYGIQAACRSCGAESGASLWHLLIDTPVAVQFWRRHPRLHALPVREVEVDGRVALVSGFASHDGTARLEIVSASETYDILHIEGATPR